ncbi:MAG: hypothetical protein COB59_03050 [Rhodospirillaceae bacterium]|nr:MAG: hypothetical protein COB59_03050 [Rhodospirillaceae bacterium]
MNKQYPKTPENTCIFAIGDVHGRLDLLEQMLKKIRLEAKKCPQPRKILVMLGDYVDRGPDSRGVLDRLVDLQNGKILKGFEVHLLKGNHEEAMLSFLAKKDPTTWLSNGGAQTVSSYDLDPKQSLKVLRPAFLKALPKPHRKVLRALKFGMVLGDYGFVHAGVRPGVAWADQDPDDLLWIRADFLNFKQDHEHMIVHGHSPAPAPVELPNRIGIDTKAWETGTLTCLVLQGLDRRFLST